MANAAAVCTSFKSELLNGHHQFGSPTLNSRTSLTAPTTDIFKCALYLIAGTIGAATAVYTTSSEVAATGDYAAGGKAFTWTLATSGTTACATPSASIVWTGVTFTGADCCLIYNSTQQSGGVGRAIATYALGTIGTGQSVTAGNFTLTMPTNDSSFALLRIA